LVLDLYFSSPNFAEGFKSDVKLDEVKHHTTIKFGKEGLEAEEEGEEEEEGSDEEKPFLMRVNQPFLLIIREIVSKAIIFVGSVVTV